MLFRAEHRWLGPAFSALLALSWARPVAPLAPAPASIEVLRDYTVVAAAPNSKASRRGVVMARARLPVLETRSGFGCRSRWYRIHAEAWICGSFVRRSLLPPAGPSYPIVPEGALTPWEYAFVFQPTAEYRQQGDALEPVRELLQGFGFGVAKRTRIAGRRFFKTAEGALVPREAARVGGRISAFSGVALGADRDARIGFVHARGAWAYAKPETDRSARLGEVKRYTPFRILGEFGSGKDRFFRFDEGAWLAARDVRVVTIAPLPKSLVSGERWIDVDTGQQIVTAYEGDLPVYATLVSTGRTGESATKRGEYRIWAKVSAIAMDNTDEEMEEADPGDGGPAGEQAADAGPMQPRPLYSLHDVPWAQFFEENYALHGVYWHDQFGNRRSHGCVNMSPRDARWFFNWTSPSLPAGWWAVHASPEDRGTRVRVR